MRAPSLALLVLLAGVLRSSADSPPVQHTVTGKLEIHPGPASSELGARRLFVLVPKDYDASKRYPVVYVLDGQDLFDEATAGHAEEWGLDELLDARPRGIPEVLVVGIEAGPHSIADNSPPGSTEDARGDLFVRYMAESIKPWVDAHWSTRPEPEASVVLGQAAGAVLAVYAAWTRSDVFGAAVAIELPELDRASLAWTAAPPARRPRLWIEQTGGNAAMQPSSTELMTAVRNGANAEFTVGGARTTRLTLVAAGLRCVLGAAP